MTTAGLSSRVWNNTAISRRDDGFIHATAMCKANGRHLAHYLANSRTEDYLQALSGSVGIPTDLLITKVVTGPNQLRGTWVHPRLAVDLARWISPQFAVWMDGWFLALHGHDQHPVDELPGNGRIDYALTLLHEAISMIDPGRTFKPTGCNIWVERKDQSPLRPFKSLRHPELADQPFSFVRQIRPSA